MHIRCTVTDWCRTSLAVVLAHNDGKAKGEQKQQQCGGAKHYLLSLSVQGTPLSGLGGFYQLTSSQYGYEDDWLLKNVLGGGDILPHQDTLSY